jgi:hypothetical protein
MFNMIAIMRKIGNNLHFKHIFVIGLVLFLASCGTTKRIGTAEIKPMSASRIMRKVVSESPKYDTYSSKRLSVEFDINGTRNSATGQIQIEHDKQLLISLRKLGFPIGKALATTDSAFVVNFIQRNFMSGDLASLESYLGFDVNFGLLQAIFTADIRSLAQTEMLDKDVTSTIDSGLYRIDSRFNKKIAKALEKGNDRALERYKRNMADDEFMEFSLWVDPDQFVVRKVQFRNIKSKEEATLVYDQYEQISRRLFPEKITFQYLSNSKKIEVKIGVGKPSLNKKEDFSFSIPEKYNRLNISDL